MTEQEMFIQEMKSKFGDLVDLRICQNGDGGFMAWDAQVAFWAWKAAQQKEIHQGVTDGYVLVPVEINDLNHPIILAIEKGIVSDTDSRIIWDEIIKTTQE